jgi:hypothetical protein
LHYFLINKGPWSRLDENAAFFPAPRRSRRRRILPGGCGRRTTVEKWIGSLTDAERGHANGFFTTIRAAHGGVYVAVPYSVEYQGELARAPRCCARRRRSHAADAEAFLDSAAAALISNDYYDSDIAWMELDASIEPTIGPYEVYEDEWFNYKAAFEAFITLRDDAETQKLRGSAPSCRRSRTTCRSIPSTATRSSGAGADPRRQHRVLVGRRQPRRADGGLQPAERRARGREKGAKRVMLKNNQEAKFRWCCSRSPRWRCRGGSGQRRLRRLLHAHPDARADARPRPHNITVGGRPPVRQEFKDTYSTIEEAKADISGLFALQFLVDRGKLDSRVGRRCTPPTWRRCSARSGSASRGARPRRGDAAQLLPRSRRRQRGADGTFAVDPRASSRT